jgi:hypothetical protein
MDHKSSWTRDDRPAVLVAQPYNLSPENHADLEKVARDFDLDVEVGDRGWYVPSTYIVQLWKKGVRH